MSIEALKATLEAKLDNPAKKSVLLGLANHAGPDGCHAYPSVRRLCVYTGLGQSTVRTKLAELRKDEIIEIVKEFKRYRPTEYKINIAKLIKMRDPDLHLLEGSTSTPTSADSQTSSNEQPDLQQTAIRPPAAGREPSINRQLQPSINTAAAKREFLKSKGVGKPALDHIADNPGIELSYLEAHFQHGNDRGDSIPLIIHRIKSGDAAPKILEPIKGYWNE